MHVKDARIWKLVPEEEDARTPWRRDYDHGSIPLGNNDVGRCNCVTHFRVQASLETIKQDYANLPYPLKGFVHQTAFVRHNSERKLDVARFRAIFEDIAPFSTSS